MADDVVVQNDDVVTVVCAGKPAVDAGRIATVGRGELDFGSFDLEQLLLILSRASVVDDQDSRARLVDGATQSLDGVDRGGRVPVGGHDDGHGPAGLAVPPAGLPLIRPQLEARPRPAVLSEQPKRRGDESGQLTPASRGARSSGTRGGEDR